MILSTSLYHPSARMTSTTSATFSFILSPVTPIIPEFPSKYGFYILINTIYCYPCRSMELIRAEYCWFMLLELLIKKNLVVLCYSVNSYMVLKKMQNTKATTKVLLASFSLWVSATFCQF